MRIIACVFVKMHLKIQNMQKKCMGICMVFFIVFCGYLGNALDDKDVIRGLLGVISASQKSDESLVELLGKNCRFELIQFKQIYNDVGFGIPEALSIKTEKIVLEALSNLDLRMKQSLYKCLRNNHVISLVSSDDVDPVRWLPKHSGSHSRRKLAEPPSPVLADTLVIPIPIPSETADSGVDTTEDHNNDSRNTLIIIVVVTAVGTFLVATILFLCCRKAFGGDPGDSYKNDGPVFTLSIGDNVISDSSPNTWPYDNSFDEEKVSNQANSGNFTNQIEIGSSGTTLSVETASRPSESSSGSSANTTFSALKPPPGRNSASSPGFSPLKPPPGRTDPPPPEAPASSIPASGMGAPPPPPPPKKAGPPPPGPPPPPLRPGPRAPPPPKGGAAPPRPPSVAVKGDSSSDKTKLKPFFWDKVMANPDHSMVWDQIKAGSFQFNEEMIESLFGYNATQNKNENKKDSSSSNLNPVPQFVQLIDPKKAQNLSILLRALNVTTEEVSDALQEGNELPSELLETLLKMAPTAEEELKLRLFSGEISELGPAERFLKVMVDIPFAFKRMEVLLFMGTLQEEATAVKDNLVTLEAACKEVRSSRLFLKLLEAVLKTGNRMNDGTYRGGAQAFKLDTLLKLADVRGTDGKTTLLHFVVQEIIRSEGIRAARAQGGMSVSMSSFKSDDLFEDIPDDSEEHYRSLGLEVVSGLGDQLQNVRKAACLDSDSVTGTIVKLGSGLLNAKNFLNKEMDELGEENGFYTALKSFVEHAEGDVMKLLEEEKRIMELVKNAGDYFHGNSGKEEGLRLFVIVRDFLIMLEKVCKEVKARPKWPTRPKREPPSRQTSTETPRTPFSPDFRQRLFPAIAQRRTDGSSSDDD